MWAFIAWLHWWDGEGTAVDTIPVTFAPTRGPTVTLAPRIGAPVRFAPTFLS